MSEQTSPQKQAITSRRRLLAYLATAMVVVAVGFSFTRQGLHQVSAPTPRVAMDASAQPTPERLLPDVPPHRAPLDETTPVHKGLSAARTAAVKPAIDADGPEQPAAQSRPAAPQAPARVYAEDLVIELSEFAHNGLAAEDGSAITGILNALAAQGEAAIPAISELLEGGEDVRFEGVEGLDADGSLRLALFDVLRRIGGAEAEAVLLGELQLTAASMEISTLAKILEEQAPGAYHGQAVGAARETLRLILAEQTEPGDVGPLFQVLHDYGDAEVVPELQEHGKQWSHYSTIALGELPGGEGIPVLVERVERGLGQGGDIPSHSSAIYKDEDLFALQMLAQVAADQPQAQAALIEQAAAGHIPDVLWPKLTQALAGVYLFQTTRQDVESMLAMDSESKTYPHVRIENEQVLYIRNRFEADDLTADERVERLAMIDEVLEVTKSPKATAELQRARDALLRGVW